MLKNLIASIILATFFLTSLGPLPEADAQTLIDLPAPGAMVNKSNLYNPLQLKGILVNVKNPLRFDFLVDKGDSRLLGQPLKDEIIRSAKYFLTCLAVPEDDLWVNLSPYEKDRIVPGNFGITLMGKDLLEQDYLLKQIMASMSYPENDLGKRFWQKVYEKSYQLYGTTNIPINTFNKVWIVPKFANVYVQGNAAFVVNSQLDVMLEADYKALMHHQGLSQNAGAYSQVLREVILPELRKEVNEGKNFAIVRQVFNAMILATWYKRHLSDSLLGKMYVGRNYVKGVDISDKQAKEKIFEQYLRAYKKCVYNYIKEDYDPITQQTVPRKYASGGMYFAGFGKPDSAMYTEVKSAHGMDISNHVVLATVVVKATDRDGAMVNFPKVIFPDSRSLEFTSPLDVIREKSPAMTSLSSRSRRLLRAFIALIALGVASSAHAQYSLDYQTNPSVQQGVKTLAVPTSFKGSFKNGEIDLWWDDTPGAKSYVIKRSDNSGDFVSLNGSEVITTNNYRDMTAEDGHTYRYEIQTVNGKVKSEFSQPVLISTIVPIPPSTVSPTKSPVGAPSAKTEISSEKPSLPAAKKESKPITEKIAARTRDSWGRYKGLFHDIVTAPYQNNSLSINNGQVGLFGIGLAIFGIAAGIRCNIIS